MRSLAAPFIASPHDRTVKYVTALAIAVATATIVSSPSAALMIDFESGFYSIVDGREDQYTESGFTFTTPDGNHFDSGPNGLDRPHLIFHEGANNVVNNLITLTFAGGAFDLIRFDLVPDSTHETYPNRQNPAMTVHCSDGTMIMTPNLQTPPETAVAVGCTNIAWVTFDIKSGGNLIFLDNLVTPEPSTGVLLAAGLAGLGWVGRRRESLKPLEGALMNFANLRRRTIEILLVGGVLFLSPVSSLALTIDNFVTGPFFITDSGGDGIGAKGLVDGLSPSDVIGGVREFTASCFGVGSLELSGAPGFTAVSNCDSGAQFGFWYDGIPDLVTRRPTRDWHSRDGYSAGGVRRFPGDLDLNPVVADPNWF